MLKKKITKNGKKKKALLDAADFAYTANTTYERSQCYREAEDGQEKRRITTNRTQRIKKLKSMGTNEALFAYISPEAQKLGLTTR